MEAACRRALDLQTCTYKSIKSILQTKMDQQPLPEPDEAPLPVIAKHPNIRGKAYYHTQMSLTDPDEGE